VAAGGSEAAALLCRGAWQLHMAPRCSVGQPVRRTWEGQRRAAQLLVLLLLVLVLVLLLLRGWRSPLVRSASLRMRLGSTHRYSWAASASVERLVREGTSQRLMRWSMMSA
jgi:hypothetical protein